MTPADRAELDAMLVDIKRARERLEKLPDIPERAFLVGWFKQGLGSGEPGAFCGEVESFGKAMGRVR